MFPRIIVVNGHARSGKDTFADLLHSQFIDCDVIKYSSITSVTCVARTFNWDGIKTEASRQMLSDLKKVLTKHFNYTIVELKNLINYHNTRDINVFIIAMIREPEEIEKVVREFNNVITVKVDASTRRPYEGDCDADLGVDEYFYDYIINNNGSKEELEEIVNNFIWSMIRT